MRQAPTYRIVDSACSRVGRATQTANTFLAALCLFFGSAIAAFVPASFEARIVYLFFFGLIPALGFYLIGHILCHMLGLSCKLCQIIAARCLRWLAPFAKGLVDWASAPVSDGLDRCSMTLARCRLGTGQWMQRLFRLAQKAYCSVNRRYRRVHWAIFEFSCLLIRNTARFVIRMQQCDRITGRILYENVFSAADDFHCRLGTGQWMQRLSRLAQKAYCSVNRRYRRVHWAIFEFSCLLIRNTARFVIRMQQSVGR
jgi:hypothetical protein